MATDLLPNTPAPISTETPGALAGISRCAVATRGGHVLLDRRELVKWLRRM